MKRSLIFLVLLTGCKFPKVVSSYYAKEVCTCLFVIGQSDKYCQYFGKTIVPTWSTKIDKTEKIVKASSLFYSTTAKYLSPHEGCQIQK